MYIGVADALEVGHDGNARVLLNARDQALAAARHDHVDIARHIAQHDPDGLAVLRRHHLHRGRGQPVRRQRARKARVDRGARARALGAAAQDRRVASLEAQRRRIRRHVRAALIDNADHAERHPHARDLEAVRPPPLGDRSADRILERCDDLEARGGRVEPLLVEREPIDHRAREPRGARLGHVLRVRAQHRLRGGAQLLRRGLERCALHGRLGLRELRRGRARGAADREHSLAQVLLLAFDLHAAHRFVLLWFISWAVICRRSAPSRRGE